jgi:phage-related protein
MPRTEVVFYRDDDGSVPVLEWLHGLPSKARLKWLVRPERLRELGHELRRPEADLLRDGVYELRVGLNHGQYRLLYGFFTGKGPEREDDAKVIKPKSSRKGAATPKGYRDDPASRQAVAVVAHGITKEGKVPDEEIERALRRMSDYRADPVRHTFAEG